MLQSYPSNMQMSVTAPIDKNWFLDFHTLNPSYGGGWEFPAATPTVFQTPATLVAGTINVWKFGATTGNVDFKTHPVSAYAGGYLLQDVSSPATGNMITDSTTMAVLCGLFGWGMSRWDRLRARLTCRFHSLADATRVTSVTAIRTPSNG